MKLGRLPPRIQRLSLRIMQYQFRRLHMPGKLLVTTDTLPRIVKIYASLDTVGLFAAQVVACTSYVWPLSHEDIQQTQESDDWTGVQGCHFFLPVGLAT
ncbi:hypothetical protein MRX96_006484 [Rhipicephalus microplus]